MLTLGLFGFQDLFGAEYDNTFIGGNGFWGDPDNWTAGVPTGDQSVFIPSRNFVTIQEGTVAEFETLLIGTGNPREGGYMVILGTLNGGNLYVNPDSLFIYRSHDPIYLSGDFILAGDATFSVQPDGGNVRFMLEAENVSLKTSSFMQSWSSGHNGFDSTRGDGPSGGLNSPSVGVAAEGGGHACNFSEPYLTTMGSAGGAFYSGSVLTEGGPGGGNILLKARNAMYMDGLVNVEGGNSTSGGAGGAITVMARDIFGSGSLYAHGGGAGSAYAAGDGGCVKVLYENTSTIGKSNATVLGGRYGTSGRGDSGLSFATRGTMPSLPPFTPGGSSGSGDLDTSLQCDNVRGISTPLSSSSVNEGALAFNNTSAPSSEYKACLYQSTDPVPPRRYFGGWVWNTNLGWISLGSFDAGASNTNRGVSTGSYEYRSYVDFTYDGSGEVTGGELYGYFWGDNMGWIRLNCDHSTYSYDGSAAPVGSDNYCGTSNHSVSISSVNPEGTANLTGYAWSDNLKWVNMEGTVIPLSDMFSGYTVEINPVPIQYPAGSGSVVELPEGQNPAANGLGAYQLEFVFKNTNLPEDDQNITFELFDDANVDFEVNMNDERWHQSREEDVDLPVDSHGDKYGLMYFDLNKDEFEKHTGVEKIHLESSLYYPKSYVPAEGSELAIESVDVLIDSGGTVYTVNLPVDVSLAFDVPYDLEMFQNRTGEDVTNQDTCEDIPGRNTGLDLEVGVGDPIMVCGGIDRGGRGSIRPINNQVDLEVTYDFSSIFDSTSFRVGFLSDTESGELSIGSILQNITTGFADLVLYLVVGIEGLEDDLSLDDFVTEASILSDVTYTIPVLNSRTGEAYQVTRPGPNIANAALSVAAANISGNIQSGAFQQIKSDVAARESGRAGSSRTVQRENMVKAVNEFVRSKDLGANCILGSTSPSGDALLRSLRLSNCEAKDGSRLHIFKFTGDKEGTFVPMSQLEEFVRTGGANPTIAANSTLVIEGANVIIDKDIYYTDGSGNVDSSKAFGLIVLKSNSGKGGHAYITSDVRDLRGHMYIDGSAFSVQDVAAAMNSSTVTGAPLGSRENRNLFYSQLAIAGSMLSQNTVGGALETPPKLGNNAIAADVEEAKKFDLNFWRYSPLQANIDTITYDDDGAPETPDVEMRVVRVCGSRATQDFNAPLRFPAGTLPLGAYPYDMFYSNTDRFFSTAAARLQALCWQESIGGVEVQESSYMEDVRDQGEPNSSTRVVNVMFEQVPDGLPVFSR